MNFQILILIQLGKKKIRFIIRLFVAYRDLLHIMNFQFVLDLFIFLAYNVCKAPLKVRILIIL